MNLLSDTKYKRGKQSVAETNIRHGSKIKKNKVNQVTKKTLFKHI
jgi:hypothetical protein